MALLQTPEKDSTMTAPDFELPGTDGKTYTFNDVKGEKGTVIIFMCNHCPYVKAILSRLVRDAKELQENGFGVAAIMPNDTVKYPADSFENMKAFANENNFSFPYLLDESQEVAEAYGAVCTPDLYGFNGENELQYRGRLDSAGPNEAGPDTKRELVDAMATIAESGQGPAEQFPSMGCSIKWYES